MHAAKKAEVSHMVPVGDGVWISFKFDSTLRLFHGTTLTCMQDLDIGPSVQRILGEKQIILYIELHVLCIRFWMSSGSVASFQAHSQLFKPKVQR